MVKKGTFLLLVFLNTFSTTDGKKKEAEGEECWWDSDCRRGSDIKSLFVSRCRNKKCKCMHGVETEEDRCIYPNECENDSDCKGDDAVCLESGCWCRKGLPQIDPHSGKQLACNPFPTCTTSEDCATDRSCRDGACVCRMGKTIAKNSVQVRCKGLNYCQSSEDCPFVDGYCDLEYMECACKEGVPLRNSAGYFYRCGPNWALILVPIVLVVLFVAAVMIVIIVLYMRWMKKKRSAAE